MSLDRRYDALLSDLLTLFQELTVRYIQQKTIDIEKFRHYFNLFYDRMQHLEGSFHQSKLKITHLVDRLKQAFTSDTSKNNKDYNVVPKNGFLGNQQLDYNLSKSFNKSISSKKPTETSYKLGSIVEEDEYPAYRSIKKRSQTAAGYRSLSVNDEKIQIRPKTGQVSTQKHRYGRQKMSKTIDVKQESLDPNWQKDAIYQHPYVLDAQQILSKRKRFYEQLQKQKNKQSQPFGKQQLKGIFKRKKSKNGWGKKINRLI